jgi:hypothetical protein
MSGYRGRERDEDYARIVVFVMDSKHRNKGIDKALNQEAEAWVKENGLDMKRQARGL